MFLRWTAKAFAAGAALQIGIVAAQDDALLLPSGPQGVEDQAGDATAHPGKLTEADQAEDGAQQALGDDAQDAAPSETRFAPGAAPAGDPPQVDDRIRAATDGLNIDDETRSRYRWHNGEWWFKTKSGQWKFYRDGKWRDFDPTTYHALTPGGAGYSPQARQNFFIPQTYSASNGYSYGPQPYSYGGDVNRYDGRFYGGSRFYDGRFDGRYYNPRLDNPAYGNPGYGYGGYQGPYGAGYRGYDPATDRYYGQGAFGQPYSVSGDRYRGGVIGSQIGGQLGGNTGAIIGGAIGAEAAD